MTMKVKSKKIAKRHAPRKLARIAASKAALPAREDPKSRTVPAGEFKAKCLAMLDGVAKKREEILVTKRGKPVARLVPIDWRSPYDLTGTVTYLGDIVGPDPELWDCER